MNRLTLFAVGLPIAVMGAWVARLNWLEHSGTKVQLAVTGYDPRDLLAGHYLNYTVNYGPAGDCPRDDSFVEATEMCVCLVPTPATQLHEANWSGPCDVRPEECPVFIKGNCNYGRFTADIERFYFPETFQSTLAVVPEKSTITVALTPEGRGIVTSFAVDGVDLLDYAKSRADTP